jgi:hypothetical protein
MTSIDDRIERARHTLSAARDARDHDLAVQLMQWTNNNEAVPEQFRRHPGLLMRARHDLVAEAKEIREQVAAGGQPHLSCAIGFAAAVVAVPLTDPVPHALLDRIRSRTDALWPPPWGTLQRGNSMQTHCFRECLALAALETPTGDALRQAVHAGDFRGVRADDQRWIFRREWRTAAGSFDHLGNPIGQQPRPRERSGAELMAIVEAAALGDNPQSHPFI